MATATDTVRVGVAGATGYAGQELLRLLARHPQLALTAAMASSATSPPRDCPPSPTSGTAHVVPLDLDVLAPEADVVFLALPEEASAAIAPQLLARGVPRLRPLRRVPAPRRRARARSGIPTTDALPDGTVYGLTERDRDRAAAARSWSRARAAIRRPRVLALEPLVDAGLSPATSSSTRSRASPAPARRRPSGRISPKCHGSVSAYGVFAPPARRRNRAGARRGRSRSCRTWCRSIAASSRRSTCACAPGTTEADDCRRLCRRVRAAPFVRLTGATLPEIKQVAYTNFCDIGWALDEPTGRLVVVSVHRQPGQGRRRPGRAELQRRVRLRRAGGAARDDGTAGGPEARRRAARGRRPDCASWRLRSRARPSAGAARRRPRRRPGDRRGAAARRHREAAGGRSARHRCRHARTSSSSVLAGAINTRFVAAINAAGGRAVGLTGADAGVGRRRGRAAAPDVDGDRADLGLVGGRSADGGRAAARRSRRRRLRAGRGEHRA